MTAESDQLKDLLRRAQTRRQWLLALRGIAICIGVMAALLLLTGWAAHRYRYSGAALLMLRAVAFLTVIASFYFALVRPLLKRIGDARLARLIEERSPDTKDRLVAAVEYSLAVRETKISPAILNRLRADANSAAAAIDPGIVVRRSRLLIYSLVAITSLVLLTSVLKWGPREISAGVVQLVTPTTLAASAKAMSIRIKPGTARVPKGSDQDILATLLNFDSQMVTLFSRPLGSSSDWQGLAMEPAKAQADYRLVFFNIQDSVEYFVESNSVRSEVYKLNVVDLPYVKQLDLTLNFPAFTHLPAKIISDGGDIAALKGTVATITARLTGKVQKARLVFPDGRKIEMHSQGKDFSGETIVTTDTSYYIELVSVDDESYRGSNEHDISVLDDQPPSVSIER
jgi:hypothetical protein